MLRANGFLFALIVCHLWLSVHSYAPIDVKLDFKAHQIHRVDTLNILAYTLLLIATVVTIWIFKVKRFKYLHETQLTIIYGLIAGAIIKYVGEQGADFTYLRVVPSGPRSFENASGPPNQSAQFDASQELKNRLTGPEKPIGGTSELTISTNANRNLTNLIRNLANVSLERLNNDFPLNGGAGATNLNTATSKNGSSKAAPDQEKPNGSNNSVSATQSTTVRQPNSTVELTTQQVTPITEHSLKPTLPLNKESLPKLKNDSSIRPTLSSKLSKAEPAGQPDKIGKSTRVNKITPKKMATIQESKETAPDEKQPVESRETNDLNKLIKVDKDELTLKLQAPPDSLVVNLNIEDKSSNVSSRKKNYVYIFKGEFTKDELVSRDDEQMVADVYTSQRAIFDPEFFFNIIIPLIIFNAGYSLKRRFFFHNLGAIFTFSIFGTIISCFTIASVLWTFMLVVRTSGFTFCDCLYFGALISATDTVTILAYFNQLNCDFNLYSVLIGESVLSDAVVIVLVRSIDLFEKEYLSGASAADQSLLLAFFHAFINFWRIFSLSVMVGFLVGILNALITKFTRLKDFHLLESSLFILMSYSAFLISELLELSGIVTILFTGICQAHYNFYNLSKQSQETTRLAAELLSFLAENFIFSYLGVSMFINTQHKWVISIILFSFIAIIVGRLLNIYPLSFLLNLNRGSHKIPLKHQHVLFFSGLRGSMAYALAMQQTISESRQVILTTTSVIIIVTVIGGGGLLGGLLDVLDIDTGAQESDQEMQPFSKNTNGGLNNGANSGTSQAIKAPFASVPNGSQYITQPVEDDKAWLVRKWYIFDCKILKPFLCNSSPTLIHTLPNVLLPLAKVLTTNEQLNNALHSDYPEGAGGGGGGGFNNVNYHGDELPEEQADRYERNSNYQRYSFENTNFEESNYLSFGANDNRQQLNELLEKSVGQLVQNSDGGQQIIFDRLTHNPTAQNAPKESTEKETK